MRLTKDQDIKRVLGKGRSVYDDIAGIKFLPNRSQKTRFAIVAGTKVAKTAVARNRLKRQVRAILAKKESLMALGFDVVVLTRPKAVGASSALIESHLVGALSKAKLIKNG